MTLRDRSTPWRLINAYRHRIVDGVLHDIQLRYVGSVFGMLWAVLYPAAQLMIYAVLYALVLRVRPGGLDGIEYTLLVFSGMVPLLAFTEAMVSSMNSLVANRALLFNTVFPAELIPLRAALAAQVPGLVGLLITLLLAVTLGRIAWVSVFIIPILWCALIMFATGIGWTLSLLTLVTKDISHGIGLVTMLLFILSPFAYTPEMVPSALKAVLWLNPLSYFVLSFQDLLCFARMPPAGVLSGALLLGTGVFLGGFAVFQRGKRVFFDYA